MNQTNLGPKIKKFAMWYFNISTFLEVLGGVIGAIACVVVDDDLIVVALCILVGVALMVLTNYITYLLLSGFGQLVENSDVMVGNANVSHTPATVKVPKKQAAMTPNEEKLRVLTEWVAQGLITTEEFDQMVSDMK